MGTVLTIPTPPRFDFRRAVCSYGYFVLAPNRWDEPTQTLHRPLRDGHDRVIRTTVRHDRNRKMCVITCHRKVGRAHHGLLRKAVARMLHLDTDPRVYQAFHKLHAKARRANFGRLFRSPTVFEDIVKTITGCNVAWANTKTMNRLLCEHVGRDGAFPTPTELARWRPAKLKAACKVGYRAERISRLARDVDAGRLDVEAFDSPNWSSDELYHALRDIHGLGDYAASNMLQSLDHYDRLAIDSETIRHFREHHEHNGSARQITQHARRFYDHYAPFQFLAYWYELWTAHHDGPVVYNARPCPDRPANPCISKPSAAR